MKRPLEKSDRNKAAQAEIDAAVKDMETQVQQRLRETDHAHADRLCERYRNLVPAERVQRIRDLPTSFQGHEDFERSRKESGVQEPDDGTKVVGFSRYTLEPAHVDMADPQVEKTAIHERMHQLSDPRAEGILGEKLYEGATEDLAIKELGREPNPELPRSYPQGRAAAQELRKMCGDNAVDRTYFQGDSGDLRACLDRRLGKGSLKELENKANAECSQERLERDDRD